MKFCNFNLEFYNFNLEFCNFNLEFCNFNLGFCNSNLGFYNFNLEFCNFNLEFCNFNLEFCNFKLRVLEVVKYSDFKVMTHIFFTRNFINKSNYFDEKIRRFSKFPNAELNTISTTPQYYDALYTVLFQTEYR